MDIFSITETQFINFFLIVLRVSGILFAAPLFGEQIIPLQLKIGLGLMISLCIMPVVQLAPWVTTPGPFILLYCGITELCIGLVIGFAAKLLFAGVQLSGQPYVMKYVVETLMEAPKDEDPVDLTEEDIGYLFMLLKTVVDLLDQRMISGLKKN